jgi:hypothetical protein|eukprot:evm.model.NODE_37006_length_97105_cov_39.404202.12
MPCKQILRPFREGRAFKVIAGLTNFDRDLVGRIARAAGMGGATHLDLAADPELVALAKAQAPRVRTMVSAIDPEKFLPCVEAGVDMLELGNFDAFYASGLRFSSLDILDLTKRTQALCPRTPLSVTIPHVLAMEEQAQLALSLAALGVDVIQTEGAPSISTMSTGLTASIEKAAPALAATYVLSRALAGKGTHVMAASGMNEVTAPMALVSGAQGVGVGTAISGLENEAAMATKVREIVRALQRNKVQMQH